VDAKGELSVDRLSIMLEDENGQSLTHNGYTIDSSKITSLVKNGDISIDEQSLSGLENFVIDARRAKCTITLPNDALFTDAIKSVLTDKSRLLQDMMPTVSKMCFIFDKNKLKSVTSDESIWGTGRSLTTGHTWSPENVDSGKLILKSRNFSRILYSMACNFPYGDNEYYGSNPAQWNNPVHTSYPILSNESDDTVGFKISGSSRGYRLFGIKYEIGFQNLVWFLARGLQIHFGYANDSSHVSYGAYLKTYLNSIYTGMGDVIEDYLYTKTFTGIDAFGDDVTVHYTLEHLFSTAYSYDSPRQFIQGRAWKYVDDALCSYSVNDLQFYLPWSSSSPVDYESGYPAGASDGSYQDYLPSYRVSCRLANFIQSIIQFGWYDTVRTEHYNATYEPRYLYGTDKCYILFNRCIEPFIGWRVCPPQTTASPFSELNYNLFLTLGSATATTPVKFIAKNDITNKLMFGKIQTLTQNTNVDDEVVTESGIPVVLTNPEDVPDDKLFLPVRRRYSLRAGDIITQIAYPWNESRDFYLDNINYREIMCTFPSTNFIATTGFLDETNWMYFDNVFVNETYIPDTQNATYYVDNIPIYDADNEAEQDNYGLYIYRDFFQNYYTRSKSPFLNIYLRVRYGNNQAFYGIIDFDSVSFNRSSISFEAVDATGVLIENLTRLGNLINFSQFDNGDGKTADLRAGCLIKDAIETLVRYPLPYYTNFADYSFSLPDIQVLKNRLISEVSAQDALMVAIQLSRVLLYTNEQGKIEIATALDNGDVATIDGKIVNSSYSQSIEGDIFSADKISKVADFASFAPEIATFYNSIRKRYRKTIILEIYNQVSEIKILDKITLDGLDYIVIKKNYDTRKKMMNLTLVTGE